jgi:hypothetical protein
MNKQGCRVILIYKAHMYTEASLDPERCTHKSDEKARRSWLQTHLRQIDQYEDITSPIRDHQEEDIMEEAKAAAIHTTWTEPPPNGSGAHAPTRDIAAATEAGGTARAGAVQPTTPTRLSFGTLGPPTIPIRSGTGTTPNNPNIMEHTNTFAPLRQQGSESGDRGNEALSLGILRGGSTSATSSSKGNRDREPIPLTSEILLLLDRLEPDKGK